MVIHINKQMDSHPFPAVSKLSAEAANNLCLLFIHRDADTRYVYTLELCFCTFPPPHTHTHAHTHTHTHTVSDSWRH